ncbi:leucine-rich repeat domain-containing protein [Zobellia laminariae]|uniref:leucine-rich repeat domain-containing protein n=1 Tax=Zobellia laminariae TaxID=248906 RepID=UPI004056A3AB
MKSFSFLTLLIFTVSCESDHKFKSLVDKEKVFIALDLYGLDSVPKEIGTLKNAKELEIIRTDDWTIYPPLSAADQWVDMPPFRTIPSELLSLKKLQKLTLIGLDLQTLPEDLGKLENLQHLDLSHNKLTISNELPKLKRLKKLRYLYLSGNHIDNNDIEAWRKENPNIEIGYRTE